MTPIFMIGTQRSGSNLLRLMINQLKNVASPHPPHILERLLPLMDNYGDLDVDNNFKMLVDDVCRLVELNPVEWSHVSFNRDAIMSKAKKRSLMSVYEVIYDLYAESQGAKSWCCKSMANINYIDEIENYFNHPKYIYLYRDGRDVALSFQKAVVGEKHIYNIAKDWSATQTKALNLRNRISKEYFYSVSYEQLTQHTEDTTKSLCSFLNADYTSEMLDFHKSQEAHNAAKSSNLWSNVISPVIKNNNKKYRKEMSKDDIIIFESVAGHILDQLNYKRDIVARGDEIEFSRQDIDEFNKLNIRKKHACFLGVDEKDKERRERQLGLLDEIKTREFA